jgi:rhomboid protease GluP
VLLSHEQVLTDDIKQFASTLGDLQERITPEELTQKYNMLRKEHLLTEDDAKVKAALLKKEKTTGTLSVFLPTKGYFFTPILIYVNIFIFLVMVFSGVDAFFPDGMTLLKWGANFPLVTPNGESWRLLTNCFLHFGIMHLMTNMYALLYIGLLLEPNIGRTRFIIVYLMTGIAASATSLFWNDMVISAGASGAIFGLYGFFFVMLLAGPVKKPAQKKWLVSMIVFIIYNIYYGFKTEHIDMAAHIGGLLSGVFAGLIFIPSLKKPGSAGMKIATVGTFVIVILLASFSILNSLKSDLPEYSKEIIAYDINNQKLNNIFDKLQTSSSDEEIMSLMDSVIYYWDKNKKLLLQLDSLQLPENLHKLNRKRILNAELSIGLYTYLLRAIKNDEEFNNDTLDYYKTQIQSLRSN